MNLIAIRYFVAVAESGNMSRTARDLFVSQPAVSKMIRQLEDELGCPLFEHRRGQVELNADGRRFYAHARKIVEEMDEGQQELKALGGVARTEIRVGCSIYDFLSELTPEYMSQNPGVALTQYYDTSAALRERVLDNSLHFAVTTEPLSEGLAWDVALECPLVMLIPQDHPASRKPVASLTDFQNDPFVVNSMGLNEEKTRALCAKAGFEPTIILNTNEAFTAGNVLNRMRAVSFCSADSVCSRHPMYGVFDSQILSHDMRLSPRTSVLLSDVSSAHRVGITRRRKELNPDCERFCRRVRSYLEAKQRQVQSFIKYYYAD